MNFFEHQDKAHRKTKLLVFYFLLAVLLIVISVNAAVYGVLFGTDLMGFDMRYNTPLQRELWMYITAGILAVISLGTLLKLFMLRHGGRSVAEMVQARQISPDTQDFQEKRLINIVEEMAIASGVSMPKLYVMDNETSINAFVAGTKPTDTVLVVTKGILETLNRDELQGVIGHEFSHIFNGDMQINVRLIGVLAGILAIGQVGRFLLRSSTIRGRRVRSSKKNNSQGGIALIAIALFMIGYIGLFFGALIKAAISRQRELLADASAIQYTRNPIGLTGALLKIKQHENQSRLVSKNAEDISHMCFGESLHYFFALLNTHPPLDIRIKRLDESGALQAEYLNKKSEPVLQPESSDQPAASTQALEVMASMVMGLSAVASTQITAKEVSAAIGKVADEAVKRGEYLYAQIPDTVREAAHQPDQAILMLLSFLVSKGDSWNIQAQQLIEQKLGIAKWKTMQQWLETISQFNRTLYLPIIEISIPALMQNDEATITLFLYLLEKLSRLDNKITPFEFAMVHLIKHRLRPTVPKGSYSKFEPVLEEVALVLSFVLAASKMPRTEREACFTKIYERFSKIAAPMSKSLKPARVDDAIVTLNGLVPALKQVLIEGIAQCVIHDGKIEIEESELLRAIAGSLDCPIPPLLV